MRVVLSLQADQQAAGLAKRLRHAETKLASLTPSRGRGKRPITAAATLMEASARVLQEPRVDGVLSVAWAKQVEPTTQDGGRGRGAVHREKRVSETIRSPLTQIARQEDRSAALRQRLGWKALVTHAGPPRLSLQEAVLCYRHEDRVGASSPVARAVDRSPRCVSSSTSTLKALRPC